MKTRSLAVALIVALHATPGAASCCGPPAHFWVAYACCRVTELYTGVDWVNFADVVGTYLRRVTAAESREPEPQTEITDEVTM